MQKKVNTFVTWRLSYLFLMKIVHSKTFVVTEKAKSGFFFLKLLVEIFKLLLPLFASYLDFLLMFIINSSLGLPLLFQGLKHILKCKISVISLISTDFFRTCVRNFSGL